MTRRLVAMAFIVLACLASSAASAWATDIQRPTAIPTFEFGPRSSMAPPAAPATVSATSDLDTPALECQSIVSIFLKYGVGVLPPDPICAVGPDHVINVTNGVIQWRPTANAQDKPQAEQSLVSFFGLPAMAYTTDPKVLYDQYDGRFVLVLLGKGDLLLAVSKTSDPNDGWWHYTFADSIVVTGSSYHADFPGLAVDAQAIYVTANMFDPSFTNFYGPNLWIIAKTPGVESGPDGLLTPPYYDLKALGLSTGTTQPTHMFGSVPAGLNGAPFGTFLVSYDGLSSGGLERVRVIGVDDPLGSSGGPFFLDHLVDCGNIDFTGLSTSGASQPDTTTLIDSGDRRVHNAVWRDQSLYLAANCIPPSGPDAGQVTAHWWRLTTTFDGSHSPTVVLADQGNVGAEDLGAGTNTYDACVMVDADNDLAVGFAASGPLVYAGAYFASRLPGDPAGSLGPTRTLATGLDFYIRTVPPDTRNRWGDYTGLALSPVNERIFWAYNEYAGIGGFPNQGPTLGQGLWYTKLGRFHVSPNAAVGPIVAAGDAVLDLKPPAPNPSNGKVTVAFDVPVATWARLEILDTGGRLVRTLMDGESVAPGQVRRSWDGLDREGRRAPVGVYYIKAQAAGATGVRRIVVLE